jgi:hypothetical protein
MRGAILEFVNFLAEVFDVPSDRDRGFPKLKFEKQPLYNEFK